MVLLTILEFNRLYTFNFTHLFLNMKLTGISWIPTYNCNIECAHCFFNTKIEGKIKYMDPSLIDKALLGFSETKHMFWHHLSGGEIFLDENKLINILINIRKYFKKDIGISTNGYWAQDYKKAYNLIKKLSENGITGTAISADYYHQQHLDLKGPKNLVRITKELNLNTHSYIMGARLNDDVIGAKKINQLTEEITLETDQEYGLPVAKAFERSIGKGSKINQPKKEGIPTGKCTELNTCLGERSPFNPAMVWIDLYGNVMICYGLKIGNIHKNSLQEIISTYTPENYPLIKDLALQGPQALYKKAKSLGYKLSDSYYDECDLCYQSRRILQKDFPEILGPKECYP